MELLGIGPLEFLVILIIALIIFSPKDFAKGAKEAGRWLNRLNRSEAWKSMRQVSWEMQNLPGRLAKEAQLDELKELEKDIQRAGDTQLTAMKEMEKDLLVDGASPDAARPFVPPLPPASPAPGEDHPAPPDPGPEPGTPSLTR
jgi:Sec-independent protein translocase protein TatA